MTFNEFPAGHLPARPVVKPPMIRTKTGVTLILDNEQITVANTHANFTLVNEAIDIEDWDEVKRLATVEEAVKTYVADGPITVKDEGIFYTDPVSGQEEECHGYVVDRILSFMEEGIDADPLINFLKKVMQNGSFRVIQDLYTFLSNRNMPLDPDGDFYGYKAVRNDWMDKHSGKISNHIGAVLQFERRRVDDNPQHDCSYGLHVGSIQYVKSFATGYGDPVNEYGGGGDRIIIVKVNPADVVAVPEHDTTKLRCCRYEVVSEYVGLLPDTTYEAGRPVDVDEDEIIDIEPDEDWCYTCDKDIDDCDC